MECYDKAIEIDPKYVDAWHNKGGLLSTSALPGAVNGEYCEIPALDVAKHEEAIKCFTKALELDPKNVYVWSLKAQEFHEHLHKPEEAIECYDKAIELDPNDARVFANKAGALDDLRKYREALECIEKAKELDPSLIAGNEIIQKMIKKMKEKLDSEKKD